MPPSPELLEAYRRTDYIVYARPSFVLKIGRKSPGIEYLLAAKGATSAAFVTACNPGSVKASALQNNKAMRALKAALRGKDYLDGKGRGQRWSEPSYLVLGIDRDDAEALGRAFRQNAIVFCEKGRAPELLLL